MNLEDETVVIGALTDAGIGDREVHLLNRRENRVDKNRVDRRALFFVSFRRNVAAAELHHHFHFKLGITREGGDLVVRVQDFDGRRRDDIFGKNGSRAFGIDF